MLSWWNSVTHWNLVNLNYIKKSTSVEEVQWTWRQTRWRSSTCFTSREWRPKQGLNQTYLPRATRIRTLTTATERSLRSRLYWSNSSINIVLRKVTKTIMSFRGSSLWMTNYRLRKTSASTVGHLWTLHKQWTISTSLDIRLSIRTSSPTWIGLSSSQGIMRK